MGPGSDKGRKRCSDGSRIRVVPELRNYHVAGLNKMAPAKTYYFLKKYDLVDSSIPATVQQVSVRSLLMAILKSRADVLEIWEPLWVRQLPTHIAVALFWRLSRPFGRRSLVSYAMENNEIGLLMTGRRTPMTLVKLFSLGVGAYIRLMYSRIAFASEGSRAIYHRLPGVRRVKWTVIDNLPGRPEASTISKEDGEVVFLARLEKRKGIRVLLDAWPLVEENLPGSSLTIIGDGPLQDEVSSWVDENPSRRMWLGALPHPVAMGHVQTASVLVLPSIREGRWREQIGLPIHEGLLSGCTVVTTDETGLASWLEDRGHRVVPANDVRALAEALSAALSYPVPPTEVVESLPSEEGRVTANHWVNQWAPSEGSNEVGTQ
jgi:glycosyltransferase involved in cell wall biosynthesis